MTAVKWERTGSGVCESRAHVGKFRLRVWPAYGGGVPGCPCSRCTKAPASSWQRWEWAIEGHECRVLASGGAPAVGKAKAMAEAAARAAVKAGLR